MGVPHASGQSEWLRGAHVTHTNQRKSGPSFEWVVMGRSLLSTEQLGVVTILTPYGETVPKSSVSSQKKQSKKPGTDDFR